MPKLFSENQSGLSHAWKMEKPNSFYYLECDSFIKAPLLTYTT